MLLEKETMFRRLGISSTQVESGYYPEKNVPVPKMYLPIAYCLLLLSHPLSLCNASSLLLSRSEINGPCTGSGGAPGVCISTPACTDNGGTYISDACPNTPENIKCCTKTACGTDNKGNCRFTSSCSSGVTETNKCPGPDNFKCCMPESGGGGGYPPPTIPSTSSGCKAVAIEGAKDIAAAIPGKVKSIGCIRECRDPSSSDHCTGMATDMMVADGGVSVYLLCPLTPFFRPKPF